MANTKKRVADIDFATGLVLATELATIQTDFSKAVFKLAKEHNMDELDLFTKAVTVLNNSVDDPIFVEEIVPQIIKVVAEESNESEG